MIGWILFIITLLVLWVALGLLSVFGNALSGVAGGGGRKATPFEKVLQAPIHLFAAIYLYFSKGK